MISVPGKQGDTKVTMAVGDQFKTARWGMGEVCREKEATTAAGCGFDEEP